MRLPRRGGGGGGIGDRLRIAGTLPVAGVDRGLVDGGNALDFGSVSIPVRNKWDPAKFV